MSALVIGAGQAGLAIAEVLQRRQVAFRIIDANERVGDVWRARYRSLTLFTPRSHSTLPGLALDGDPNGYPDREQFAAYLERYAAHHRIVVETGKRVERLDRSADGLFIADLSNGERITATAVIAATGGFQQPIVPSLSEGFSPDVLQLTSDGYRDPSSVPAGPVLVVGDGASGRDIAAELSRTRNVILAAGKPRKLVAEKVLGLSIWWWMDFLGLMRASPASFVGRTLRRRDPFPDRDRRLPALKRRGVEIMPRLVGAEGEAVVFADGRRRKVGCVIWAVGYRDDTSWIGIPGAVSPEKAFVHDQGLSPVPGLYFIGRPWQRNRASALVLGAGRDAAFLGDKVIARLSDQSHVDLEHRPEKSGLNLARH